MSNLHATVIGAGLAGAEAAWQLASKGISTTIIEMKPYKKTPAHELDTFAELVCSNSLRSNQLENAAGLLKEELRRLNSLIIQCADATMVPAGGALAVDRTGFSALVTRALETHSNITIVHQEMTSIPQDGITIIASGPLTSDALSTAIAEFVGSDGLYFFDAAAPIVTLDSLDMTKVFRASRYGKGTDDYLNCPMNEAEYLAFYEALVAAEAVELKDFEPKHLFEGCMPIESMAARGVDTMRFGPLKPVGLVDPRTNTEPYAVVQLRQDNKAGTQFNLVGFQTHLKWAEQKRVFRMIPGLENAEFERFGVMHRNTFLDAPKLLDAHYAVKQNPNIYFAGQMTGVEGYVESTASGYLAGISAAYKLLGQEVPDFPDTTAIGALACHVSQPPSGHYQPKNINFGIIAPLGKKIRHKREKNTELANRALAVIAKLQDLHQLKADEIGSD